MGVPWDMGVWFVGADDGEVLNSTPAGWMCLLPYWAPDTSYVQRRASPDREWGIYYAESADVDPVCLGVESRGRRFLSGYAAPWLGMVAIQVEQTTAGGHESVAVYMVPVAGGEPQEVTTASSAGRLVGVLEGANKGVEALLIFSAPSGISAIAYPSGDRRWHTALAAKAGVVTTIERYDEDEIIVVEEPLTETADHDPRRFWIFEEGGPEARLWVVDLATGSSHLLAECSFPCDFVDVLVPEPGGERQLFCGGIHSIYRVTEETGRAHVTEVVKGSGSARPGGARVSPEGDVICYVGTMHCLWRCNLADGNVELLFGTPGDGDEPPEIVARGIGHQPRPRSQ